MDFRLLGPLEVADDRGEVPVGGGRRRALLALLLLHRNEVVPSDRLIDALWDGRPPPTAAKALQVHVSGLRKDLAQGAGGNGAALRTRAGGYVLEVAPGDVDVARFERAVAEGEQARVEGREREASALLREGLAMWRGPPLVDFAYDGFAQREIARLGELRLAALEQRIDADLALGRHRQVVAELEDLAAANPLRERLRGQLMLALHRCGRQADALEVYRTGRSRSVAELGLEPGAELRELQDRILADDPQLAPPPPPPRAPWPERRAPVAIFVAGVLLVAAAVAVLLRETGGGEPSRAAPALDIAPNSVAGLDARSGRALFAVPLPGRPTDMAAAGDRLFAVSIDSSALTVVDGAARRLSRTVPLPMRPAAVAVDGDDVWVADGRRGLLVRMDAGYERVARRVTWKRAPRREAVGLSRLDPTALALAGGAAWVTDGSAMLMRVDAEGLTRSPAGHTLDGVAAGAGAVWAISRADAALLRISAATGRVTDEVRIVARPGSDAPAPIALAVTGNAVWVLNANTATVTRIDPRTLGITGSVPLSHEMSPRDIEAGGGAVWVTGFDGTVTRIAPGEPRSSFLGESLVGVAGSSSRVWAAAIALDQQIPGGD
jgi:DNA-binding SARP family transcriptional activator/streptogramin lyase